MGRRDLIRIAKPYMIGTGSSVRACLVYIQYMSIYSCQLHTSERSGALRKMRRSRRPWPPAAGRLCKYTGTVTGNLYLRPTKVWSDVGRRDALWAVGVSRGDPRRYRLPPSALVDTFRTYEFVFCSDKLLTTC